jgi:plasmid stabilization system protein ParE
MAYSIKWSPVSEITYADVLDYLAEKWGLKEVEGFMDRTDEVIGFIQQNPKQYIYSKRKKAYRAVVTKQVSLYYRIQSKEVELLLFWDTRQNPDNLKL